MGWDDAGIGVLCPPNCVGVIIYSPKINMNTQNDGPWKAGGNPALKKYGHFWYLFVGL